MPGLLAGMRGHNMSRKHYKMIAKAIARAAQGKSKVSIDDVIMYISIELQKDNPRFNISRFEQACKETGHDSYR